MTTAVKFVKSFSSGQITIPKDFRELLGVKNDFWLRMKIVDKTIVAEPVEEQNEKKLSREAYIQRLLSLKTGWFNAQEITGMRKKTARRLKRLDRQLSNIPAFQQKSKRD